MCVGGWIAYSVSIVQLLFKSKFHLHPRFDYVMYIKEVLESNVVAMSNITTGHWGLICAVNGASENSSVHRDCERPSQQWLDHAQRLLTGHGMRRDGGDLLSNEHSSAFWHSLMTPITGGALGLWYLFILHMDAGEFGSQFDGFSTEVSSARKTTPLTPNPRF